MWTPGTASIVGQGCDTSIGFKITFLDCVIDRRRITIQPSPSGLAKNVILKPIASGNWGRSDGIRCLNGLDRYLPGDVHRRVGSLLNSFKPATRSCFFV